MAIQGIDRVRRNLRVAVENIAEGRSERAIYEILSQGAAMAQTMTPIDTSNLINSQTAPQISNGTAGVEGRIGYTAAYAAAVHDAPGTLAGQPRDENDPSRGDYWAPNAEPEFLTKGFDQIIPAIPAILRRTYRV
ncbi:hypothetical protein L0G78_14730 [Pseudomonas aeruginosa]|uniref:hypothetical protein n=1 Tax=Pseudomonas aeruginosa TaxID=287 RepID=UPI001F38586E|nr:hypothetical protein [Pseudomonas aeruginosa]MCF1756309.1 hypothetical protein [Pseudomonas aeruginosa]